MQPYLSRHPLSTQRFRDFLLRQAGPLSKRCLPPDIGNDVCPARCGRFRTDTSRCCHDWTSSSEAQRNSPALRESGESSGPLGFTSFYQGRWISRRSDLLRVVFLCSPCKVATLESKRSERWLMGWRLKSHATRDLIRAVERLISGDTF